MCVGLFQSKYIGFLGFCFFNIYCEFGVDCFYVDRLGRGLYENGIYNLFIVMYVKSSIDQIDILFQIDQYQLINEFVCDMFREMGFVFIVILQCFDQFVMVFVFFKEMNMFIVFFVSDDIC